MRKAFHIILYARGDSMKIIHTADWHLGKILNGQSFLEDQRYILNQFVEAMKNEEPDAIVIAGDLYDNSTPNKETVKLLEATIAELNLKMHLPLVIISGNHDGRTRLNYGSNWFEHSNLYIRTSLEDMYKPITINGVNFYTLPYATIGELQHFFKDEDIQTYEQGIECCLSHMSEQLNKEQTNILVGHLTVAGGITSDSERYLSIGTVEQVPQNFMKQFDSVMLGHLHHPFSIQSDFVFYSGSLLQYSFSETNQSKGYRVVNIDDSGNIKSTFVPLQPLRQLEVIQGTYEDAIQERLEVKNNNNYIHFSLTNLSHINDPMLNLKQIYPNVLSLTNESQTFISTYEQKEIKKMTDQEIIEDFYSNMTQNKLSEVQVNKINALLDRMIGGGEA